VAEVRGGFSPAVAARVAAGDRTGFVKACGPIDNRFTIGMYREETRIAAALPEIPALAPLRWSYDDGDWAVLGFDDLGGGPPELPWSAADLDATFAAVAAVHTALTPSPVTAATAEVAHARLFTGWRKLTGDEPGLDEWSRRHLAALQEIEAHWPPDLVGDTLLHGDLRADNVVLAPRRGAVVVDWPAACVGPPWFDLVCFAPSVAAEGGPPCTDLLHRAGVTAPEADLAFAVVGVAGYFTGNALRPAPPTLPTVRTFQARQGVPARRWPPSCSTFPDRRSGLPVPVCSDADRPVRRGAVGVFLSPTQSADHHRSREETAPAWPTS
jgi:hypothetical protein